MYKDLTLPSRGDRVLVAMSGGVDSTVAAVLLHDAGCRVTGITMTMRSPSCYAGEGIAQVKEFCRYLGVPHVAVDVSAEYRTHVLDYFVENYRAGLTPNPCIECNRRVKFGAMLRAIDDKWDYYCTGHYARMVQYNNIALAAVAADSVKDQSYFLSRVPTRILERVRFPLGNMTKTEVRATARSMNLAVADNAESQDFLSGPARLSLFANNPPPNGDIVDMDGNVLGHHNGLHRYTVGQRRGLAVARGCPLYVVKLDAKTNTVVLGKKSALMSNTLTATDTVWHVESPSGAIAAMVKVRGRTPPAMATVYPSLADSTFSVHFAEPQRAIAPGQQAVVYVDGAVWGAGVICA